MCLARVFLKTVGISLFGLLACCSSGRANIPALWSQSVIYFDGGVTDGAIKVAEDLRRDDPDGSDYLIGQYMIYASIRRNDNFQGMSLYYDKLSRLELSNDNNYKGHYIAAKTFALESLLGKAAAKKIFTEDCKAWKGCDPIQCIRYLIDEALRLYVPASGRFDAIYLYESSWISKSFGLLDRPISDYYLALALVQIDNKQANVLIGDLDKSGSFSAEMKENYCKFVSVSDVNKAINCHNWDR